MPLDPSGQGLGGGDELAMLKQQAEVMRRGLEDLEERIRQLSDDG